MPAPVPWYPFYHAQHSCRNMDIFFQTETLLFKGGGVRTRCHKSHISTIQQCKFAHFHSIVCHLQDWENLQYGDLVSPIVQTKQFGDRGGRSGDASLLLWQQSTVPELSSWTLLTSSVVIDLFLFFEESPLKSHLLIATWKITCSEWDAKFCINGSGSDQG